MDNAKFRDFFKFYRGTPEQNAAVDELYSHLPAELRDEDANWVRLWRKRPPFETVDWQDWEGKISRYFTVGEAFNHDPCRRERCGARERANIITLASHLDVVREEWGPLAVTSWFRDKATNAAVGGAEASFHLTGLAVDCTPVNRSTIQFQGWAESNWPGGVGRGAQKGFVHLDLGPRRVWDY